MFDIPTKSQEVTLSGENKTIQSNIASFVN